MKAIVYHRYGGPEVLGCEDLPKPEPGDDEVLIRVRAASVNPMDCSFLTGVYLMRLMTGFRRPKLTRPGVDMAGEVEAVGRNVTRFKTGDPVFGAARGAFAEYVTAAPDRLALKPATLGFAQAAAIPVAGMTALQGLRDKLRIQPGQRILVTGSSGGVGSFAVQIAKAFGAEVTALCSTRSVELVRSLGADHVIDYSREDFTRSASRYDLIFDTVGNRPLSACRRVMTPKGTFLAVGARPGGRWIGPLPHLLRLFASRPFVSQRVVFFVARVTTEDLNALTRLIESNQVTPVVDRVYPFAEVADAFRYLKEGHPRGKVVVRIQDP
ncbi:MAG TPA: NAD(P)-dependent alcohol dehydrogenase [Gemmatimonadales bacterium]|nr:NAD(P)-dependent alcohol dehydrogenase [Gemmatimonadales bacterium]